MILRPPRSTRTDTLFSLHAALPIAALGRRLLRRLAARRSVPGLYARRLGPWLRPEPCVGALLPARRARPRRGLSVRRRLLAGLQGRRRASETRSALGPGYAVGDRARDGGHFDRDTAAVDAHLRPLVPPSRNHCAAADPDRRGDAVRRSRDLPAPPFARRGRTVVGAARDRGNSVRARLRRHRL